MKPSSLLLLTAAGLASALPAQQHHEANGVVRRSFFNHAVDALSARNLIALNANTAPLPGAEDPAEDKKGAAPPPAAAAAAAATTSSSVAAVVTTTTAAVADNAAAASTTVATVVATDAAAATTATTATAAIATATNHAAAGNGTASDNGKGKGKGKGGNDQNKGKGGNDQNNKNKGHGKNNNNSNDNSVAQKIIDALAELGLQDVLNASQAQTLNLGDSVAILSQIVSLQTMKNMKMATSDQVVVILNQSFKNSGLNVVIA